MDRSESERRLGDCDGRRHKRGYRAQVQCGVVLARHRQIQGRAGACSARVLLCPDIRPGDAAGVPGRHRQGIDPSLAKHACGNAGRAGRRGVVRGGALGTAPLSPDAHHATGRCRAGRASVSASDALAHVVLSVAARGRHHRCDARAGDCAQLPHRPGADRLAGPGFCAGFPGGDVLLQPAADADRCRLSADLLWCVIYRQPAAA
ncbi:hypothetical protein FQZ97_989090 [compost metagenome]